MTPKSAISAARPRPRHHRACPSCSASALTHSVDRLPPPQHFANDDYRRTVHLKQTSSTNQDALYKISIPEEYRVHVNYNFQIP
jgi:hypothetical protein